METHKDDYFIEVFGEDDAPGVIGRWYYRLKHVNGNKLATSQGYVKKANAIRAAKKIATATGLGFKVVEGGRR